MDVVEIEGRGNFSGPTRERYGGRWRAVAAILDIQLGAGDVEL